MGTNHTVHSWCFHEPLLFGFSDCLLDLLEKGRSDTFCPLLFHAQLFVHPEESIVECLVGAHVTRFIPNVLMYSSYMRLKISRKTSPVWAHAAKFVSQFLVY